MIRMWWVIRYLSKYNNPASAPMEVWFKDVVSREYLVQYLIFKKHYREDWRDTLERWLSYLFDKQFIKQSSRGLARARKQRKEIDDIIDNCISRNYILEKGESNRYVYLTTDYRGRNFLKPVNFLNAVLAEYGHVVSLIVVLGGGSLLTFAFIELAKMLL